MATRKKHAQRSRYSYHTSGVPERMFVNHAMHTNNMKMLRNNNGIGARVSAFFKGLFGRRREPEGAEFADGE